MHVEIRNINDVRPYPNNPREQWNQVLVAAVAAFDPRLLRLRCRPSSWTRRVAIVVGDTRPGAAKKLGLTEVPVHVAAGLTPAQCKAYRIADNKSAELADWDNNRLVQELADLQKMNFDMDLAGFSADELGRLLDAGGGPGLTDPDDIPEPPDEPTTQPGDLWTLGAHRLLCGDSAKPQDVDWPAGRRRCSAW